MVESILLNFEVKHIVEVTIALTLLLWLKSNSFLMDILNLTISFAYKNQSIKKIMHNFIY